MYTYTHTHIYMCAYVYLDIYVELGLPEKTPFSKCGACRLQSSMDEVTGLQSALNEVGIQRIFRIHFLL
jgi:hypothetical protein